MENTTQYEIQLENFIGPFEVLFDLIQKEELDIYNIPIHRITGDFIKAIQTLDMDERNIADFLTFAAMLLEIKSQMLLPDHMLQQIDLEDMEDPRRALLEKLLQYQELKEQSLLLQKRGKLFEGREYGQDNASLFRISPVVYSDIRLPLSLLEDAWGRILLKKERFNEEHAFFARLQRERYSVEEKKQQILKLLMDYENLVFDKLSKGKGKSEKIAMFLALLKMQQEQSIHISQPGVFDTIRIERKDDELS